MTDEQRKDRIRSLLEERRGYVMRGLNDRVQQVDAELRLLGAGGRTPQRRAERRG